MIDIGVNDGAKRIRKMEELEESIRSLHRAHPELEHISQEIAENAQGFIAALAYGGSRAEQTVFTEKQEILFQRRAKILAGLGLDLSVYEPKWDCPLCQDRGYVKPGEKCQCRKQIELMERLDHSGLAPLQAEQPFDHFSLQWYEDQPAYRRILEETLCFAEFIAEGKPAGNLVLYGPVGTGKTHLCSAVANYVLQSGKTVLYVKIGRLLDLIRQNKFEDFSQKDRAAETLDRLYRVDLLIIDDWGTESRTDFTQEQLLYLLDERMIHRLPWMVSTNLTPNELESHYEDRLSDRLLGMSKVLKFSGQSVRWMKKNMR
jgi:DNA replication protein DnaC